MYQRSPKTLLAVLLLVFLMLVTACKTEPPGQDNPTTTVKGEEQIVDESIERDAQMLMDALTMTEINKERAVEAVQTLRNLNLAAFSSLNIVKDVEYPDYNEQVGIVCELDIRDVNGLCYRIGFLENGYPYKVVPPEGSPKIIINDSPVHH